MSIDITSDIKVQTRFRNKHQKKVKEILKRTHFDSTELDVICLIYLKLLSDQEPGAVYIMRHQLRTVLYECLDMPDDFLVDRIMVALDKGITPYVTLETWIMTMSLYLRGTLEEKMLYCFTVYDIFGDGIIRRDQLITLSKKCIFKAVEDVEDFVDLLIRKMDADLDGALSYRDYCESVEAQPLLLECFGHCLPDRADVNSFLSTFTHKISKF